jgi:N-glycosidase YbiA
VCNPVQDTIIKATVSTITKMGILAYGGEDLENPPLNILLAIQHHQDNEEFSKLQEKDIIYVKVLGKRFEYGDSQISIIGLLVDTPDNANNKKQDKSKSKTKQPDTIVYFNQSKNYKWLSNFNVANPFTFKDREYVTMEHAYQAQQVESDDYKDLFTKGTETYIGDVPNAAKKAGNKTNIKKMKKTIVSNWNDIKAETLKEIMIAYFEANPELKTKLIQTGQNELVFKGLGVDGFWGIDKTGEGENNHGKLLMELREEFNSSV